MSVRSAGDPLPDDPPSYTASDSLAANVDYTHLSIYRTLMGPFTITSFRSASPLYPSTSPTDPIPLLTITSALLTALHAYIVREFANLVRIANYHGYDADGKKYEYEVIQLERSLQVMVRQWKVLMASLKKVKGWMSMEAAELMDVVAGQVGLVLLKTWVTVRGSLEVGEREKRAMEWRYCVRLCGGESWRRLEGLCALLSERSFVALEPKAQAALISLPTGRFMVQLALLLDPYFVLHTSRKITNFFDKRLAKGVPCKSPICEYTSRELQQKIGYQCTCGKASAPPAYVRQSS